MSQMTECGWEWPDRRPDGMYATCPAPGPWLVRCRPTGEVRSRCLNHAMRDVWGGQWEFVESLRPGAGECDA
jgi:hypothetical protein